MKTKEKAVLMSIQPKWCELILSGKKTIEVRKTQPKIEVPFKVYIYCTQSREMLWVLRHSERAFTDKIASICTAQNIGGAYKANGKVIGEFICDKIDVYEYDEHIGFPTPAYDGDDGFCDCGEGYWIVSKDLEATCLTHEELLSYGKKKTLYGWHISDLVIYDSPKDLSEFAKVAKSAYDEEGFLLCDGCDNANWKTERVCTKDFCPERMLKRPPQSWCYVEKQSC